MPDNLTKITMHLSPETMGLVNRAHAILATNTKADVVRRGITLLDMCLQAVSRGERIVVEDRNGNLVAEIKLR